MPPRISQHGIDLSVPTAANLPTKAAMGQRVYIEDTQSSYIYDSTLGLWIPDGPIVAYYNFATHGGAVGSIDLGVPVPEGFVIVGGVWDVTTAFTSGGSAEIGLTLNHPLDLKASTAIGSAGTVGRHALIPVFSAATSKKSTGARNLKLEVAVAALTAGALRIGLYGYMSRTETGEESSSSSSSSSNSSSSS